MRIIDQVQLGNVGTPEFARAIQALAQMADVACKGGLKCVAVPAAAGTDKDVLNAAAAGTFKKLVKLQIQDATNRVQKWFNGSATLTPTESVADAQVAAPAVTGGNTVNFQDGEATVELTYDTDAGATKTYVAGDKVGFTTAVANVFGSAVTVTGAVFDDTIVA
ncbi:MAG: hypothetical protein JXA87_07885 [Thermoleophilia bacterium]|nr:hypothetical protein [Thermoleophilia bacterium]